MDPTAWAGWKNQRYFGDNLAILRLCAADGSVDLIYLDPPSNSNVSLVGLALGSALAGASPCPTARGEESAAQITAFEVTVAPFWERRRFIKEEAAVRRARPPLQ